MTTKGALREYRRSVRALDAQFDADIERYRKADALIRVQDREGNPVPGAQVSLSQKTHDFTFGCNALQLGQMGACNAAFEESFARLFNLATTTICWSVTETRQGFFRFSEEDGDMPRRPPLERVIDFGRRRGIRVKGQPLMADSWIPDWASRDAQTLRAQWVHFVETVARRYASQVDVWDVVNEAMICPKRTPLFPLLDEQYSYVDWCFEQAARVFPKEHGVFELNEGAFVNWGESAKTYERLAQRLLDKGLPLESIGFQFHQFSGAEGLAHLRGEHTPVEQILETYHSFEKLGVPLSITEITLPSRLPGLSPEEGEEVQAEVAWNLYRLWFSRPNMSSIIYWNFMDGKHWGNEGDCRGCLLDVNMREKPVYQALYQLINRRWHTDAQLETDAQGECCVRGFKGDYELTVDAPNGHTVLEMGVHRDGDALTVTL